MMAGPYAHLPKAHCGVLPAVGLSQPVVAVTLTMRSATSLNTAAGEASADTTPGDSVAITTSMHRAFNIFRTTSSNSEGGRVSWTRVHTAPQFRS